MTLYDRIQSALARPDGRVMIRTYTKATLYTPKHARLFIAPRKRDDLGVYVMHGKQKHYVYPQYVLLGHATNSRGFMPERNDAQEGN